MSPGGQPATDRRSPPWPWILVIPTLLAIAWTAGLLMPRDASPEALEPSVEFNAREKSQIQARGGLVGYGWPAIYRLKPKSGVMYEAFASTPLVADLGCAVLTLVAATAACVLIHGVRRGRDDRDRDAIEHHAR